MSHPEKESLTTADDPAIVSTPDKAEIAPTTAEQTKSSNHSSTSSATIAPAEAKAARSESSSAANFAGEDGDDPLYSHLAPHERQILKKQLDVDETNVSFFGLYRYASRMDILVLVVSAICAIAAGAALPLFTVCACDRFPCTLTPSKRLKTRADPPTLRFCLVHWPLPCGTSC